MKLTLQTQLFPDETQAKLLKDTILNFNAACNWLAEKAFELQTANKLNDSALEVQRFQAD